MEDIREKINIQVEKLKYLDERREKNLKMIEDRVKEIREQNIKSRQAYSENKR
jgi:hypothetical protein